MSDPIAAAPLDRRLSIAPMLDWTTRDYRMLMRLITRHTLLYTEMVTAPALLHGDRDAQLDHDAGEHPMAVQLGGSDPVQLAEAARICEQYGYGEINLNVGCPSDRVQSGMFGACLMATPQRVADCVAAMQAVVSVPVTVKSRIGIDDQDDYAFLHRFIDTVQQTGCRTFIIHARKAILSGLSPKENREIPPLIYARAEQVKQDFPQLEVILNGGLRSLDEVEQHLQHLDGAMIGREAYHNPLHLADADPRIFGQPAPRSAVDAHSVVHAFMPYLEQRFAAGVHPKHILRHLLGLFQNRPGARAFRRHLSTHAHRADATPQVLLDALALVPTL
ncbi:tRNA dihydrouridine(20/20a) synthase DusA [Isoalcanivorax beigongshangi]|uniref:tRNA-dihydrouridine(20/20a) synthase n=1 Tax=Isoalcanivorax beigongshangi TaxID=3238810 RepID=A0ABV4AI30_9GAMM